MPSRDRHPWSHDDCNRLADLVGDGYPVPAIAHALGRTVNGVTGMVRKAGLKVLRGKTHEMQIQLLPDAYARLKEFARARRLTVNTFCRITLETCSREQDWVDRLLDDLSPERNEDVLLDAAEEPEILMSKLAPPTPQIATPQSAPISITMSMPLTALQCPQLVGSMA
jgi:hypothetical protein